MKFKGLMASILEQQLFDILYKLEVLKQLELSAMDSLIAALNAGRTNFGTPSKLIIDPYTFDSLKNTIFDDKTLIKKKLK